MSTCQHCKRILNGPKSDPKRCYFSSIIFVVLSPQTNDKNMVRHEECATAFVESLNKYLDFCIVKNDLFTTPKNGF